MTKMSLRAVFFGNERLATGVNTSAPILSALLRNGYKIKAVVLNNQATQSRSAQTPETLNVAKSYSIPILTTENLLKIREQLQGADVGILVAFGRIIPGEIINIFPKGIVNLHPSLLPLYRGPTPIESAILNGDQHTGMSVMKVAKDLDAGPIYGQAKLAIKSDESKQELSDQLLDIGQSMLLELLPGIASGDIVALPQDESGVVFCEKIDKSDGLIDWRKPADILEREIRAYLEWPKSHTKLAGIDVIITQSSVLNMSGSPGKITVIDKKIVVFCAHKSLKIEKLKPVGKKEMATEAFLAGYGKKLEDFVDD